MTTASTAPVTLLLLEVAQATSRVNGLLAYPTAQNLTPAQEKAAQDFLNFMNEGKLDQMSYSLIDLASAFEGDTFLYGPEETQKLQVRLRGGATAILDALGRK